MKRPLLQIDTLYRLINATMSTLNVDDILTTVVKEIQGIIQADRCTLFIIDKDKKELYSKVIQADNLVEIRVPLDYCSLAGYSAVTGKTLNITDVYNDSELKSIDNKLCFDKKWDKKSGYRTKNVMVMPIKAKGEIAGVFQCINKPGGFSDSDMHIMKQLSFLLSIAVNNALNHQAVEEERRLREYIMDHIEEGICILNTKKKIISANRFLEIMSGYRNPVNSIVGRDFFDIFPNFLGTKLEEKIHEVFIHGFRKTAMLDVLEVRIVPYHNDKGKVQMIILIFKRY